MNWLLHRDNAPSHTSFFAREFLTKSSMAVVPHPSYFHLFSQLKGRQFDTTEAMEAESHAVLDTHRT
jgi:hypothetical protein